MLPRWNGARRSTFISLTPTQGRDFIRLSHLWLIIVSIIALKLKDRPWWNLRGTEMTDGGRGPEHGQNTLVSKTCSFMLDNGGRKGGAVGYKSRFQPAEGSHHFGYNNNLIHVASFKRLNSKTKLKEWCCVMFFHTLRLFLMPRRSKIAKLLAGRTPDAVTTVETSSPERQFLFRLFILPLGHSKCHHATMATRSTKSQHGLISVISRWIEPGLQAFPCTLKRWLLIL